MQNNNIIQLHGITKSFGPLQVLRGIDLQVNRGEVMAIVGPSGAGKTTLLQIMGTLDRPDHGEVIIDGECKQTLSQQDCTFPQQEHRLCIPVSPTATGIYRHRKRHDTGPDRWGKQEGCPRESTTVA